MIESTVQKCDYAKHYERAKNQFLRLLLQNTTDTLRLAYKLASIDSHKIHKTLFGVNLSSTYAGKHKPHSLCIQPSLLCVLKDDMQRFFLPN